MARSAAMRGMETVINPMLMLVKESDGRQLQDYNDYCLALSHFRLGYYRCWQDWLGILNSMVCGRKWMADP